MMFRYLLAILLFFSATGIGAADVNIIQKVDAQKNWLIKYDFAETPTTQEWHFRSQYLQAKDDRKTPYDPATTWVTCYQKDALELLPDGKGLKVKNDSGEFYEREFFCLTDPDVLNKLSGTFVVDLKLNFVDFGKKDYAFMFVVRVPDSKGVVRTFSIKVGQKKCITSAGGFSWDKALVEDRLNRLTLLCDTEGGRLGIYLDGKPVFAGKLQTEENGVRNPQIVFGDGGDNVGGCFILNDLKAGKL